VSGVARNLRKGESLSGNGIEGPKNRELRGGQSRGKGGKKNKTGEKRDEKPALRGWR